MSQDGDVEAPPAPDGLGTGGRALWDDVVERHWPLTMTQVVQLTEACRAKDRLDRFDAVLRGDVDTWMTLTRDLQCDEPTWNLRVTGALSRANETAQSMKQLLAALRLPDEETGRRPQRRGPRGAQAPSVPGGRGSAKVSPMDAFRQAKGG